MSDKDGGKLQGLIEKWGGWSAMILLSLVVFVYQSDRTQLVSDNKALSARTAANERAIGRLQEGKASREELRSAIDTVSKDNAMFRQDFKEGLGQLRSDLVQRMDFIVAQNKK